MGQKVITRAAPPLARPAAKKAEQVDAKGCTIVHYVPSTLQNKPLHTSRAYEIQKQAY